MYRSSWSPNNRLFDSWNWVPPCHVTLHHQDADNFRLSQGALNGSRSARMLALLLASVVLPVYCIRHNGASRAQNFFFSHEQAPEIFLIAPRNESTCCFMSLHTTLYKAQRSPRSPHPFAKHRT